MKRTLYTIISVAFAFQIGSAQTEIPNNEKVTIFNESTINTKNLEYSPAFFENGIVFISSDPKKARKVFDFRQGKKASTIMISRRGPEGMLNAPEVFAKEITSSYNDGPVSFDRTNETIFFSTNNQSNTGKKIKAKDGLVKQKIQSAKYQNGTWTELTDLPFNDIEFVYVHPSLSVDGNMLFFSSNKDGGFGGMDLYVSKKEGDVWGEPENLGPNINSDKNEVFPYSHPDGTLYFACDGKNTLGGLDIFSSVMQNDEFQEAVNIGKPFNSEGDDFGFILDLERKNGYFTSNRAGGKGEDDVFSFTSPEKIGSEPNNNPEKPIVLLINDNSDGMDLTDVSIKICPLGEYEIGDQVTDREGNIIKLTSSDSTNILSTIVTSEGIPITRGTDGKITANLKNGDYFINLSKDGYKTKQTIVNINDERAEMMLLLEKISDNSVALTGVLKSNRDQPIANATVTIRDENSGEVQEIKTDNFGKYSFNVKPNTTYSATASKDNHLAATVKFNTGTDPANSTEIPLNMVMAEITTPLPTGRIFQLTNVYYNYNDATLRPDAKKDLDPLVILLKTYPEVEIELASHTDSRGKAEYNLQLSQLRAESVVKYLTDSGIDSKRVKAVGYGESKLRNNCKDGIVCSDAEHQVNRRTEVRVSKGGNDLDESIIEKFYGKTNTEITANDSERNSKTGHAHTRTDVGFVVEESDESGVSSGNMSGKTGTGNYLVVAGSFQKEINATNHLNKMKGKGFETAEVRLVPEINFYRVVISESPALKDALTNFKKLKAQRIPAFIIRD